VGYFMKHNDILIGSMLDQLNLRFAPPQGREKTYGGIEEMAALQKEFQIFKKGRPFAVSVAVLNLAAYNNDAKNHWHDLLGNLKEHKSNRGKMNGDEAVVDALVKNLAAKKPLPVYFTSHDMRAGGADAKKVLITDKGRPVFYIERDYLVISLPMKPWDGAEAKAAQPAKKGAAKPAGKSGKAKKK
jgi:mRNA-degrading endonuclease YafQ of YafQ-DinJ toxin-antitoxin module